MPFWYHQLSPISSIRIRKEMNYLTGSFSRSLSCLRLLMPWSRRGEWWVIVADKGGCFSFSPGAFFFSRFLLGYIQLVFDTIIVTFLTRASRGTSYASVFFFFFVPGPHWDQPKSVQAFELLLFIYHLISVFQLCCFLGFSKAFNLGCWQEF